MIYIVRTVSWKPERRENVEVLKSQIPQLTVLTDTEEQNDESGWKTFFDAMRMLNSGGGVLLEDDIQLCENFIERIESVIAQRPDDLINFFEKPKVERLVTKYVGGSNFSWNQCTYYPKDLPIEFLNEYETFKNDKPKMHYGMAYDCLMAHTLAKIGRKYWMVRPCMVQHLPMQSAINGRPKNRQTPFFVDDLIKSGKLKRNFKWEL